MRLFLSGACVILSLAVVGTSSGQGKKLPALAHDATLVSIDEKKGIPTKVNFECSEEDGKKLGYKKGHHAVTKATKFIYVGPDGEKSFTQKTLLGDADAKKSLEKGAKIRLQLSGIEVEEMRFGPNLKAEGVKRVR